MSAEVKIDGLREFNRSLKAMDSECSIEGCAKPVLARGWCPMHYQRWRTHGDPLMVRARVRGQCAADGCEEVHHAGGYCAVHYARWKKHGDPEVVAPQMRGARHPRWRGGRYVNGDGYVRVTDPHTGKRALEHHVVMRQMLGRDLLPGENVHHKNGIRDDNRPENLELWVTLQPHGQRPEDLVEWAREVLRRYDR